MGCLFKTGSAHGFCHARDLVVNHFIHGLWSNISGAEACSSRGDDQGQFIDKSLSDVAKLIISQKKPKDVLEQQAKVAQADAIVFISPLWWNNFPTILKGWVERVLGDGYRVFIVSFE